MRAVDEKQEINLLWPNIEYSNKFMHVLLKVPLNITVVLYTSCQTSLCEHGYSVKPNVK